MLALTHFIIALTLTLLVKLGMAEAPGGAVPAGMFRVPCEWARDQHQSVLITTFNPEDGDTITDQCREALMDGHSLEPILADYISSMIAESKREWICEGLKTALAEIIGSQNPKKTACALCFASGMDLTLGKSGPDLAREFGVRKQDFFQEVERIQSRFGGRLIRINMRDGEARDNMRKRNYRR